jgi:hypothetical protein
MDGSSSSQDGEAAAPFPFGVRVGIILIAEMSMMSVGAVVALFFYVLVSILSLEMIPAVIFNMLFST